MKITCSKCGNYLELKRIGLYKYCNPCHAEYQRLNRKRYHELSPEQKKRSNARSIAKYHNERKPCEKCGYEVTEFHHEDYDKPKDVISLCRTCHIELHNEKRKESA